MSYLLKNRASFLGLLFINLAAVFHFSEAASLDPSDWRITKPVPGEQWVSICSHNGVNVLGSLSGAIYYSTNLESWTLAERPLGHSPMLECISYKNGFIGAAGSMILMSEDGKNWESFVVDNLGVDQITVSHWHEQWLLTEALRESSWFFNDVVEPYIDSYRDNIATKTLYRTELSRFSNFDVLQEVQFVRNDFILAVGEYEFRAPIDDTKSNSFIRGWIARYPDILKSDEFPDPNSIQLTSGPLYSLAFSDDVYLIVGGVLEAREVLSEIAYVGPDRASIEGKIYQSEDAWNWEEVSVSDIPVFKEIKYHNQRFVAAGQEGSIWSSADGLNWDHQTKIKEETDFQSIYYENGIWMVAGINGVLATAEVAITTPELPVVTIRTEGFAEEGVESQAATVFLEVDGTLSSDLSGILEFDSNSEIARSVPIQNPETDPNAIVKFVAVYDQEFEGDQFLEITLIPDPTNYKIELPFKARIQVLDSATDRWRNEFFQETELTWDNYDAGDFDLDGFSNLSERVFGTDPLAATSADEFKIKWSAREGLKTLEAEISQELQDLEIYLETSADGIQWERHVSNYSLEPNETGATAERSIVYWHIDTNDNETLLIRLFAARR